MAKAKKTENAKSEIPNSGAKKPAAKAAAGKSKPAAKPAAPLVNTSFAAEAAARMIGAKAGGGNAPSSGEGRKETSTFKQLKQSLAKPHSVGNLLNSTFSPGTHKSNLPFHGGKQVGHNQTFGADANSKFVPRRTGG